MASSSISHKFIYFPYDSKSVILQILYIFYAFNLIFRLRQDFSDICNASCQRASGSGFGILFSSFYVTIKIFFLNTTPIAILFLFLLYTIYCVLAIVFLVLNHNILCSFCDVATPTNTPSYTICIRRSRISSFMQDVPAGARRQSALLLRPVSGCGPWSYHLLRCTPECRRSLPR